MSLFDLLPTDSSNDNPLPLIVANRWGFPLAHIQMDDGMFYAVQDWMRGLTGEEDTRKSLNYLKKQDAWVQMSSSTRRLPYKAADGKTYKRDYINANGLYLIAQYLRVTEERPVLGEIRRYLAASGVMIDEVRLEPSKLAGNEKDADKMLNAFIEYHRKRGKDDGWIQTRIEGTIKRNLFTRALTEFVIDTLTPARFATATDDVYTGLWERTAAQLREQLAIPKNQNLRDHQPRMALHYQGIVEEACAYKLGNRQEVTWNEARSIIQAIATMMGRSAAEMSELLQMDIATGKPLLTSG